MTETHKHPDDAQHDELDRTLDAALAKYAAVEPRAGLEDRILANLQAERTRLPNRAWWRWGYAVAMVVALIVAILAWKTARPSHAVIVERPAVGNRQEQKPSPRLAKAGAESRPIPVRVGRTRVPPPNSAIAAASPKLDVFPSPRPLSEEELALAQYVRNFPSDANQVAREQEASEREVLAKMQELANKSGESN
ncbi:MAG TPA: hypothetical protein VKF84_09210 [Candidatus Sulfotelmatobacter sp.]|nr:hypothetical protein [Candidatus Sulfotelmatobacter sp.]